jgi:dipeptidyl aminopeptidase/acylaminoacyl peptidase
MKPSRTILSLFLVIVVSGACGKISPPATTQTSIPQATRLPTIIAPSTLTSMPVVLPTSSPTATLPSAILPVCHDTNGIELEELTLAFIADWDGDDEIYLIQADGSGLFQVTDNTTHEDGPKWSPDGRQLAFVNDFVWNPRLMISNADGSNASIVAPDLEVSSDLVWSPTGETIVFRSFDDLYAVDVDSGAAVNLTSGANFGPGLPSFSHDGERMVFEVNMLEGTPRHRLFTVNVDGTDLEELSFLDGDAFTPTWHPSKEEVLFEGIVPDEGVGLYLVNFNDSISKLPVEPRYRGSTPLWSPDGEMIVYIVTDSAPGEPGSRARHSLRVATEDGNLDIPVIEPPEGGEIALWIGEFVWAPDNRHIAYTTGSLIGGSIVFDLQILDICGGTSTLVVEDIADFVTPSWRPLP